MYQIDNPTAVTSQPASTAPGTAGFFTDGSPSGGVPATVVPAEWLNAVQQELINAIIAGGGTPSKTKFNQLALAIAAPPGRLLATQRFISSGTYTPTPGTRFSIIEMVGGGGSGGGSVAGSATSNGIGGGGGGGAYAKVLWNAPVATPFVIAAGVSGGTPNNPGPAGNSTTFGSLVTCPGGSGGSTGAASNAAVVAAGGFGAAAPTVSGTLSVINTSAGSPGFAGVMPNGQSGSGGVGASTPFGGGGIGSTNGAGSVGGGVGSGGGGALSPNSGSSGYSGGFGNQGLIIVQDYA